jgi:hypothetical protein
VTTFKQRMMKHRDLPERWITNVANEAQAKMDGFVESSAYSPSWPSSQFPVTRYHPTDCDEEGNVPSVVLRNETELEEYEKWVDSPVTARGYDKAPQKVEQEASVSNRRPCPECGKDIPSDGVGRRSHMRTHEKALA